MLKLLKSLKVRGFRRKFWKGRKRRGLRRLKGGLFCWSWFWVLGCCLCCFCCWCFVWNVGCVGEFWKGILFKGIWDGFGNFVVSWEGWKGGWSVGVMLFGISCFWEKIGRFCCNDWGNFWLIWNWGVVINVVLLDCCFIWLFDKIVGFFLKFWDLFCILF